MPSRETISIISLALAAILSYIFVAFSLLALLVYMVDTLLGTKIMTGFIHDLIYILMFSGIAMMIFYLPLLDRRK